MAASSSAPIKETVYGGPAVETIYRGAATTSAPSVAATHTVYDPSQPQGRSGFGSRSANVGVGRQEATPEVKRAAIRLFIISALSLVQYVIFRDTRPDMATGGLVIAVIFCVLGIFAWRMSKAAFVIGMLLYGGDTALLILAGVNGAFSALALPIFIHCIFLFRLWAGYQSIKELSA